MKNILFVILVTILFSSCTTKDIKNIFEFDKKYLVEKKGDINTISLKYINETEEKIFIIQKLSEKILSKNYTLTNNSKRSSYEVIIKLILANEVQKSSVTQAVLKNVNLGISIGHVFGNVGVSGNIGGKIGDMIGDKLDSNILETIFEVTIKDIEKENTETSTIIIETSLEKYSKSEAISMVENELTSKIITLFE